MIPVDSFSETTATEGLQLGYPAVEGKEKNLQAWNNGGKNGVHQEYKSFFSTQKKTFTTGSGQQMNEFGKLQFLHKKTYKIGYREIERELKATLISEVWGIGANTTALLKKYLIMKSCL